MNKHNVPPVKWIINTHVLLHFARVATYSKIEVLGLFAKAGRIWPLKAKIKNIFGTFKKCVGDIGPH